jgi:transcriptional regulator with XRE-family HTH domain
MTDQAQSLTAQSRELPAPRTKRIRKYRGVATTRLERFIRARGLFPAQVGMASDVARSRLQLWRAGKASPMLSSIRKLVQGLRQVTADQTIKANDLFPLDDDD